MTNTTPTTMTDTVRRPPAWAVTFADGIGSAIADATLDAIRLAHQRPGSTDHLRMVGRLRYLTRLAEAVAAAPNRAEAEHAATAIYDEAAAFDVADLHDLILPVIRGRV